MSSRPVGEIVSILLDASISMREGDFKPSRMEAAKAATQVLVEGLMARNMVTLVSLTLFYRRPVTVLYPTDSLPLIRDAVESSQVLGEATALGDALAEALRIITFFAPPRFSRRVIVVTDGTFNEGTPPQVTAKALRRAGARVDVLSFSKLSRRDVEVIEEVTRIGGGVWLHARVQEDLLANAASLASSVAPPPRVSPGRGRL